MADKDKPRCMWCNKPGGRLVIDPYQEELYGVKVKVRLHKQCLQERREEI